MEHNLKLSQGTCFNVNRRRKIVDILGLRGRWRLEHWRDKLLIGVQDFFNDIVNQGKNKILNVMFNGDTQILNNSWFVSLVDLTGFTAFAAADVMNSHAGWAEITQYDEATRPGWGSGTTSTMSVTNAVPITFTMNATKTVHGIFIASNSTKGGTTGTLWSTAAAPSDVNVVDNDELKVTYTLNA